MSELSTKDRGQLAGKYLTFKLSNEEYGLEILKVREIIGLMAITQVPRTPACMRGVINLRGKIIPVVDLRVKFELPAIEDTEIACIVVVEVRFDDQSVQMGVLVDTVSEVLAVTEQQIEPAPTFGNNVAGQYILGMAKVRDSVKILLDIDQVLGDVQINRALESVAEAA